MAANVFDLRLVHDLVSRTMSLHRQLTKVSNRRDVEVVGVTGMAKEGGGDGKGR